MKHYLQIIGKKHFLLSINVLLIGLSVLLSSCKNGENNTDSLSDILYNPISYNPSIPQGFPELIAQPDNPLTQEGVQLGRRLFYDTILSADGTMSCASCHKREHGFADITATSKGIDGIAGTRSAMSLLNVGFYNKGLHWDGKHKTLEQQAEEPVSNPIELHEDWGNVEEKLQAHADYPARFRKAFGISTKQEITKDLVVKALSQFQRIMISGGNSKFDRVQKGEAFFSDDEFNGNDMFFDISPDRKDAECGHCHTGALMTTNEYINNGVQQSTSLDDFPDQGRGAITNHRFDNGKFRVPTLRNIALTPPYMHDGRFETLEEVVEHYNSGGHYADNLDPLIVPLGLNEKEKQQIVIFLHTLTDTTYLNNPDLTNPFE